MLLTEKRSEPIRLQTAQESWPVMLLTVRWNGSAMLQNAEKGGTVALPPAELEVPPLSPWLELWGHQLGAFPPVAFTTFLR